jgi:hypothetical protein
MMLNPKIPAIANELAGRFRNARPFRHIVIDDFLTPDYCAELLRQFPPFERGNARNEAGELGAKSTVEKIRGLGGAYAALDNLIQTREFLDLIGTITGIRDLRYDPWYFGGGTHDNREGQDLDPHVDFNRHLVERWHRRLNLIVYLNHEWNDAWGGSLELHSDPRSADDRVELITPLFNRTVIFETTENSWHGFSRIALLDDKKSISRKSIALYFYTNERPLEETADTHATIYVDRPLPERFHSGATLSDSDVQELRALLGRRDQHNQRLYRDISALTAQLEEAHSALHSGLLGRLRYFVRRMLRR